MLTSIKSDTGKKSTPATSSSFSERTDGRSSLDVRPDLSSFKSDTTKAVDTGNVCKGDLGVSRESLPPSRLCVSNNKKLPDLTLKSESNGANGRLASDKSTISVNLVSPESELQENIVLHRTENPPVQRQKIRKLSNSWETSDLLRTANHAKQTSLDSHCDVIIDDIATKKCAAKQLSVDDQLLVASNLSAARHTALQPDHARLEFAHF